MTGAATLARFAFGAWMVFNGLNHFALHLVPVPSGATPLAAQLIAAFDHSGLLAVAMAFELIGGALLLSGIAVPFALALLMPLSTCALFWAVLDREPLWALLALLAFALNGLLMLCYLDHYRDMLRPGALAAGESEAAPYHALFANPLSNAPAAAYPAAALALAAALAFYWFVVPYTNGTTGLVTLAIPTVLLAAGWVRALTRKA
jgi:hypothetical protein